MRDGSTGTVLDEIAMRLAPKQRSEAQEISFLRLAYPNFPRNAGTTSPVRFAGAIPRAMDLELVDARVVGRGATADTALISDGYLDSFSFIELRNTLETELNVTLPTGALIPEDFESPAILQQRLAAVV